jgi:preprotein translocase subunit YajC
MKPKTIISIVIIILIIIIGAFLFIQANSHNTKVDVISNSSLKNGDKVQIVLTDEYRNVYPGEKVQIKILDDSGWANYYDVVTDNSGEASVALSTLDNGNYTIHTNYNGTLFNKAYHGVDSLVIDDGYGNYGY